jgi:hypothetical protein
VAGKNVYLPIRSNLVAIGVLLHRSKDTDIALLRWERREGRKKKKKEKKNFLNGAIRKSSLYDVGMYGVLCTAQKYYWTFRLRGKYEAHAMGGLLGARNSQACKGDSWWGHTWLGGEVKIRHKSKTLVH